MKHKPWLLLSALILAGCITPFPAPKGAKHIVLTKVDSARVAIEKIWLARDEAGLVVKGYVIRQDGAKTTTETHLDIMYYGEAGQVLAAKIGEFEPSEIPKRSRPPAAVSEYRIPVEPAPEKITRIEVRAHDGPRHAI